uniref:Uncharacterized protein n=1 Tax=Meloidogyne incognita TaxID=6306 RepID=A0A914KM03_MELIC
MSTPQLSAHSPFIYSPTVHSPNLREPKRNTREKYIEELKGRNKKTITEFFKYFLPIVINRFDILCSSTTIPSSSRSTVPSTSSSTIPGTTISIIVIAILSILTLY